MNLSKDYKTTLELSKSSVCPFNYSKLRFFLSNRHRNGLEAAVRKMGQKLYIDVSLFEKWIKDLRRKNDSDGTSFTDRIET